MRGHLLPQPAPEPVALTYPPQRTTATFQYKAVDAKRATCHIAPDQEWEIMVVGENAETAEDHVGRKSLLMRSESSDGASRFVYSRCFAQDFPERSPLLFDPAQVARSHS